MEQKLDIYTRILCDLCGKECDDNDSITTLKLQPYRGIGKIDICEKCMQELFEEWEEGEADKEKIAKMVARVHKKQHS